MLQDEHGEWWPTPAYDLPSSQPYGDSTPALSVHGRVCDPGGKDFLALGAAIGLPDEAARRVLTDQAARVPRWLPLLAGLPFDLRVMRELERVVQHRRARLLALG